MNKARLRAIAAKDASWTDIAQYEEQLKAILRRGFEEESDVTVAQKALLLVLAELAFRRGEMSVEENEPKEP